MGELESTDAALGGAREGPALVPEELRLDQRLGERGAIQGDERAVPATALEVNGIGHQFLAGAAPAADQDVHVVGSDLADQAAELLHTPAAPDESLVPRPLAHGGPENLDLGDQATRLQALLDDEPHLLELHRLDQVVGGSQLHGADGRCDRPVARHHDHGRGIVHLADPP